ncbi:unnamed protein product [Spirodela intermedia]|uniref:Uncharacterized protein n=1 Tax=Spirodela intermedia TaxID=51605 RepID=A0A7I8K9V9_SPIIN|nr:unnamed protein product [Spirodela intermedia]
MRGGRLKEFTASTVGEAIASSRSTDPTVESLSSLFVTSLKGKASAVSSSPTKEKKPEERAAERIATWKRSILSARSGGGLPGISDLGPTEKNSEFPARVSSKVLSVLKEARSETACQAPAGGEKSVVDVVLHVTSALQESQSEEANNGILTENNNLRDMRNVFKLHMQKEKSRERKAKWTLKDSHNLRFSRLIKRSAEALGTESTLEVLGKLGKETGVKEYNALIGLCIEKARRCVDESDSLIQLQKAFQLFRSMKEQGFQIEEESYGPLLMYLIDMRLIQEFQTFCEIIKDDSRLPNPRTSYFEMLLWIKAGNEEKIQELCHSVRADDSDINFSIAENYLLAFCVGDRKKEMLHLLNVLDMRRISSLEYLSVIFKTLGKSSLENLAVESILALKSGDTTESDISSLIFDYTSKIPDLAVEEVVSKYIGLHVKVEVTPSVRSYEKLTAYCCNLFKVCTTLDPLVRGTEQICRLDWVRELCSVVRRHSLKLDKDCSRSMMSLYVMIKDFEGAYNLLAELKEMNMEIDASLYNKNIHGGLKVLKEMKHANVKPDSETFSYLIFNCGCEEDIVKCLEEMKHFQADFTKHTYIALINAYANCGKFDQAKQVIEDKWVPVEHINEIKGALITALSSKGRTSDALEMYDAMKQAGCWVEPKAIVSIIEFYRSRGQTKRLLQLLAELENSCLWFDACGRVVLYCIRNNLLSAAVDLLRQMKEKDEAGTCSVIDQIFCQIWETEPTNMEIGMGLLWAIKEELGLLPTRASLDFLLSACVKVKDLRSARSIWVEYSKAGLPFNVLSYLRMYHALMAGGDFTAAQKISKLISHEDKHVSSIIRACKTAYTTPMDDLLPP